MIRSYHLSALLTGIILMSTSLKGDVTDITGDTGTAQSGSLNISGGTSGSTFDTTTTTITESFNFLSLPSTTATNGQILIGAEPVLHAYGTGDQNIYVGSFAGNFSATSSYNTACGGSALSSVTSGDQNIAVGQSSLVTLTEGGNNTAIGTGAGTSLTTGKNNELIGIDAGTAYTGDESYNIIVGPANPGTAGESNVIRIGTGQQQTACYVDGIWGEEVDIDTGLPVYVDDLEKLRNSSIICSI